MNTKPRPTKLKLPAFGKALLDNRRAGWHPLNVDVLFGDDWREASTRMKLERSVWLQDGRSARPYESRWLREVGVPMLALRPREYAPGVFDFGCVRGCAVRVIDLHGALRVHPPAQPDAQSTWGVIYDLFGELALQAASVAVCDGVHIPQHEQLDCAEIAYMARHHDGVHMQWPRWWSDEIEAKRGQRQNTWFGAAAYAAAAERSATAGA